MKGCFVNMLTLSPVQISNISVKISSFILLSTLSYGFSTYDIARAIVSSTNAVGVIMICVAPILVRELSRGANVFKEVNFLTLISATFIYGFGLWREWSAVDFCLVSFFFLFFYRGLVDYLYIAQDKILARNWVLVGVSLAGTLLALISVDIIWILSLLYLVEIVSSLKLLSSAPKKRRHDNGAHVLQVLAYSFVLKFDVFVLLFLSQTVTQSATFLMLHASQIYSVFAVLRLHKWFDFIRNLTSSRLDKCSDFMRSNAIFNSVILCLSIVFFISTFLTSTSTFVVGSMSSTVAILITIYGYKIAFQDVASVSNYLHYTDGRPGSIAVLCLCGLLLPLFFLDVWLGCIAASSVFTLFVLSRGRISTSS